MAPRHLIPLLCDRHSTCTLTRKLEASNALRVLRAFHCENGGSRCERARRLKAGEPVPPDLLPDGRRLAETGIRLAGF